MGTEGRMDAPTAEALLKPNERLDDLQRSGLRIIQEPSGNRFSTDAVLLSSYCAAKSRDRVADLGTGTGILPLLIWAKWRPEKITGVEIDPETADMASRSVLVNNLEESIAIVNADLKDAPSLLGKAKFTLVVSNPPYIRAGEGMQGISEKRALARHEIGCTMDDVAKAAAALLVPRGRFALVHRPDRLCDIMVALRASGLEPKAMRMVHNTAGDVPSMVLITAVKGASRGLKMSSPLIVYDEQGKYTAETEAIYFG